MQGEFYRCKDFQVQIELPDGYFHPNLLAICVSAVWQEVENAILSFLSSTALHHFFAINISHFWSLGVIQHTLLTELQLHIAMYTQHHSMRSIPAAAYPEKTSNPAGRTISTNLHISSFSPAVW